MSPLPLVIGLLLLAVAVFVIGITRRPAPISDAEAQSCCWAPKGDPTRCYPCRPTRESNTP